MALLTDAGDREMIDLAERNIKKALTEGLHENQAKAVMTAAQYSPTPAPDVCRDYNRDQAGALVVSLRSLPVRLPVYSFGTVPLPERCLGALIYVSDGAAGAPCIAFSSGTGWVRVDSLDPISLI